MEANKILNADILDIIFDGRNKEYGGYELRKTYNKRLVIALCGTFAVVVLFLIGNVIANRITNSKTQMIVQEDVHLQDFNHEEKDNEPPPPPPKPEPPKLKTAKLTALMIVKNQEIKEDEKPPEVEMLEQTKTGKFNHAGDTRDDIVAPPIRDEGKDVIMIPNKDKKDDETFRKVEIESQYPGGPGAWMRYLNKTFRYPEQAQTDYIQGTVVVQFIVDIEGNISNVEALSGPTTGGLREEAVRVIKKSGKWEPAIQNGRKVKSFKEQPITFKLEDS